MLEVSEAEALVLAHGLDNGRERTFEGWGMRLTFVDEEHVDEDPAIVICESEDEGQPSDEP